MLQRLEIEPPIAESSRGVLRESSAACAARALPGGAAAVSAAGGRRTRSLPAGPPPVGCRKLVRPEQPPHRSTTARHAVPTN